MKPHVAVLSFCLLVGNACAQPAPQEPRKPEPRNPEPRNTAPRTTADPELADALRMMEAMKAKEADGAALMAAKCLSPLREVTEFRRLVRDRAPVGEVTMVVDGEPGTRLVVRGSVVDAHDKPVVGALVYVYQTDQKGWYSDRAGHFTGDGGDFAHARLFGYVKTDARGEFRLRTIRPAGYPRTTLPEHIHWQVFVGQQSAGIGEIWFDDDARLTQEMRERAGSAVVVCKPVKETEGLAIAPKLRIETPSPQPRK